MEVLKHLVLIPSLGKPLNITKAEYERLVRAAKSRKNGRLSLMLETICATGIRVSELRYITVEAVKGGRWRSLP